MSQKKNILVFGASSSKNSINAKFAQFAANQLTGVSLIFADLNDFELPVYSIDLEREIGIPKNAERFSKLIKESDGIVASFAEHNGLFTSAFKNLWDWMSRMGSPKIWDDKPMFLLSTSITRREQNYVVKVAQDLFPHYGGKLVSVFYLPSYNYYFQENRITQPALEASFKVQLNQYQEFLTKQ